MSRSITIAGAIALLITALAATGVGAGRAPVPPVLVGTWEHRDADGEVTRVVLNDDGTGKMDDDSITFTATDDAIDIKVDGEVIRYKYVREADGRITVSGGDLDEPTTFTRVGGGAGAGVAKRGLGAKLKKEQPQQAPEDRPAVRGAGTWETKRHDGATLTMQLNPDGTGLLGAAPLRWALEGDALVLHVNGGRVRYDLLKLDDAELRVSGGDLPQPVTFTLAAPRGGAGAGAGAKPDSVVGKWNSDDGPVELNADGTGSLAGAPFKYRVEGDVIVLTSQDGQTARIPFRLEGDRVIVTVEGERGVLTRAGGAGGARDGAKVHAGGGVAGVYVAQESSVDPTNAMVLTQYLILYPDGAVGWAKSEMGATRQSVGEHLERFTSFRNGAGHGGQTFGTWQANGNDVVVQWRIWNNLTCRGRLDPASGSLMLEKMGTLDEGATLEFKRQR